MLEFKNEWELARYLYEKGYKIGIHKNLILSSETKEEEVDWFLVGKIAASLGIHYHSEKDSFVKE